jgi:uncharacterized protein YabE (DUF348 family)
MSKAIYFAGVSRVAGVLKFRTAASPARFQQLGKLGDTDVEMINVNVDSKSAAAKELLSRNFANGRAEIEALLVSVASDDNPFAKPKARTVTIKRTTVADAVMAEAKVKFANEDKLTPKQAAKIRAEFNAKVKAAYEAN